MKGELTLPWCVWLCACLRCQCKDCGHYICLGTDFGRPGHADNSWSHAIGFMNARRYSRAASICLYTHQWSPFCVPGCSASWFVYPKVEMCHPKTYYILIHSLQNFIVVLLVLCYCLMRPWCGATFVWGQFWSCRWIDLECPRSFSIHPSQTL